LAKEANIPVIITDSYPDFPPQGKRFPNYLAFIGPSDEDAGYQMAKALFAAMKPGPDGKKVIGVVNGTPGTSVAIDRRKGLERALKENPDVRVAGEVQGNFVRDASQTAFESLYQGHPDITGAWFDIGGHWLQGGFALVLLFDDLKGIPVPKDADTVKLKLLPLTQDRVAQFEKDFPGGVTPYDFKAHSRFYNKDSKTIFEIHYSE
jgi:hypothetical protein